MDVFHGGSFVLLPHSEGIQASCNIVAGSKKDEIGIRETSLILLPNSGAQRYQQLRQLITEFISNIIDLQGSENTVHITCGVGNRVNSSQVLREMFPDVQQPIRSDIDRLVRGNTELVYKHKMRGILGEMLGSMFTQCEFGELLDVDVRYYENVFVEEERKNLSDHEALANAEQIYDSRDVALLRRTLPKIIGSDSIILPNVISAVQRIA